MRQKYLQFEVVVALDRCSDGSLVWLQQLKWERLTILDLQTIPPDVNGKKFALLQAIKKARHPFLLLTDADCDPRSYYWIDSMMRKFQGQVEVVLGYSPYHRQRGLLNRFIRYETLITAIQYLSRALNGKPYMGVGRNLAYTKDFFESTHQWGPFMHLHGGDDDLLINHHAQGNGTAVSLNKNSQMKSAPKTTLMSFLRQKKRHLAVGKHYKSQDKLLLGIFSVTHIIFWSSLVSLLVAANHLMGILVLFLIRQISLSIVVSRSGKRLDQSVSLMQLIPLDFLYSVYYAFMGVVALTSKKVNWR